MASPGPNREPLKNIGPRPFRCGLIVLASLYLVTMVLGEVRSGFVYRWVPGPLLYFTQVAGLFTESKRMDVDFRAEGWSCQDGLFREIDVGPQFPIQPGNKENRFQRAVYFYGHNPKAMHALDRFITDRHNAQVRTREAGGGGGGGNDIGRIGGVRILSAVTPIPEPSEGIQRYSRKPLSEYPFDRQHTLYETPDKTIWKRCKEPS
jgi:hypothetical protein